MEVSTRIAERVATELTTEIKAQIYLTDLANKEKIAESFYCEIEPNTGSIQVKSTWDPAFFLNNGTKPFVRTDLVGKKAPVKLRSGQTVIRTVTWRDIMTGHWRNPGIRGRGFLDRALIKMRARIPQIIKEEIKEENIDGKTMSF